MSLAEELTRAVSWHGNTKDSDGLAEQSASSIRHNNMSNRNQNNDIINKHMHNDSISETCSLIESNNTSNLLHSLHTSPSSRIVLPVSASLATQLRPEPTLLVEGSDVHQQVIAALENEVAELREELEVCCRVIFPHCLKR